ncbi:hypothetical protein IDM40_12655 [Nocardiopsis sp. HNM0947]|uniref:MFS transporter n=1 Tax=Nocardiopsis coralli TaxID=2772213 RepID=A0ABR9P6R9_9ACTN|nr:hypothetical protein [Nocardiopsis coralli]MBE2999550.1 hypothetical protein [Nocardiopsis coralli]
MGLVAVNWVAAAISLTALPVALLVLRRDRRAEAASADAPARAGLG